MRTRRQEGVRQGLVVYAPLPLAALGTLLLLLLAMANLQGADEAVDAGRATRLTTAVWRVGDVGLREVNARALADLGTTDPAVGDALGERRVVVVREVVDDLEDLAAADDAVAEGAEALLAVVENQRLDRVDRTAEQLWDAIVTLQATAAEPAGHEPRGRALADLGEVVLIPSYVLNDAIDVEYERTRPPVPVAAESYFLRSVAYVTAGDTGWLAADPADPFSGRWVPRASVRRQLPAAEAGLDAVFVEHLATRLVELDRWSDAAPTTTPPPATLERMRLAADRVQADLAAVMTATVQSETDRLAELADEGQVRGNLLLLGALLLVFTAGTTASVLWWRRRTRMAQLERAAATDGLTGLANRRAIQERVPPRLADPDRAGHVVVQIDLDRFKAVNDAYGHRVGDELLLAFARRTEALLDRRFADHDGDREFARVGGDEFLVVLHDVVDPRAEAAGLVAALEDLFRDPVACGPVRIRVDLSGGIAVAAGPTDLDHLLLEADIALYQAKGAPHRSFCSFDDPVLRDIMRDFPGRIAAGAVTADLQPQFDLVTGAVVGFEALARWRAEDEHVPAAVWVRAVEQLGGADLLFEAMARSVAAADATLGSAFTGCFWLNLSPLQLGERTSADRLLGHLAAAGLAPDRVGVEVVETAAFSDLGVASDNLEQLRAAGVLVALDDFGSGFTPLGHLTALPVDHLKIDRAVVAGVDRRPRQAALVEATVTIAAKLGFELVAEGIETEAERDTLLALGVRVGQGYLLGRPAGVTAAADRLDGARV